MDIGRRTRDLLEELQADICGGLEEADGRARFREDRWDSGSGAGGGVSRVLEGGLVFERAGVGLADIEGRLTDRLAARLKVPPQPFRATGISLVVHPLSPMVPAVHMNLRRIEIETRAWFGGGADLTPYYLYEDDAAHFHRTWRAVCESYAPDCYPRFKKSCDAYFRLEHRQEARGIGGIFFDDLDGESESVFEFIERAGRAFLPAYGPIVERRRQEPWWDREREWQLVRRGRYVEFNLIQDRGTLFGLEMGGRAESILMSLPPLVRWVYDHRPRAGSREEALLEVLAQPRDWA